MNQIYIFFSNLFQATVSDPCTSKNVLCVGASQVSNAGFQTSVDFTDLTENIAWVNQNGFSVSTEADCCAHYDSWVRSMCCPSYMKSSYSSKATYNNNKNMASFSNRGPVYDEPTAQTVQRIKPGTKKSIF